MTRTLTLDTSDPKCTIAADALSLVFEGTEDGVIARGKPRSQRALVGDRRYKARKSGSARRGPNRGFGARPLTSSNRTAR